MLINKRQREDAEIPGASLADIAFLLLVFFLLVTTIDIDTGIGLVLPPEPDDTPPPHVEERNMLKILVNARGMVLLDGEHTPVFEVRNKVKEFVDNHGQDPDLSDSPDKAIVSIKSHRQTRYSVYINMFDEVVGAYDELRNRASQERFGIPFHSLDQKSEEYALIKNLYPKNISKADPDQG